MFLLKRFASRWLGGAVSLTGGYACLKQMRAQVGPQGQIRLLANRMMHSIWAAEFLPDATLVRTGNYVLPNSFQDIHFLLPGLDSESFVAYSHWGKRAAISVDWNNPIGIDLAEFGQLDFSVEFGVLYDLLVAGKNCYYMDYYHNVLLRDDTNLSLPPAQVSLGGMERPVLFAGPDFLGVMGWNDQWGDSYWFSIARLEGAGVSQRVNTEWCLPGAVGRFDVHTVKVFSDGQGVITFYDAKTKGRNARRMVAFDFLRGVQIGAALNLEEMECGSLITQRMPQNVQIAEYRDQKFVFTAGEKGVGVFAFTEHGIAPVTVLPYGIGDRLACHSLCLSPPVIHPTLGVVGAVCESLNVAANRVALRLWQFSDF